MTKRPPRHYVPQWKREEAAREGRRETKGLSPETIRIAELFARDIRQELDLAEAAAIVQQTIEDAKRWADYYQPKRRGRPKIAEKRRSLVIPLQKDAERIAKRIELAIPYLREPLAELGHPLHPAEIERIIQGLRRLSEACATPSPGIRGRPSKDDWLLAFVWRMAQGWRELTGSDPTSRGRFCDFLAAGLPAIDPDREPPDSWESLIETATKRFHLKSKHPIRPGDDLDQFEISTRDQN